MSEGESAAGAQQRWEAYAQELNQTFVDALERNVEAQAAFVESWLDAVEDSTTEAMLTDGVDGYARAYDAWMHAAQDQFERVSDAIEGEEVTIEEFRDVWLNTANRAFKEVMSTNAFAATTGETVGDALQLRRQVDEATEETLHGLGLPTTGDVSEVGERLVELERRQHDVETKLDRLLDAVEG